MATPVRTPLAQPARTTAKSFNPNKSYPVRLSERLKNRNEASGYSNASIQIDPAIKLGPTAIAASIESEPTDSESVAFKITDKIQSKSTNYKGTISEASKDRYVFTFDAASQTLVLDKVDTTITIAGPRPDSPGHGSTERDQSVHSDDGSVGSADPKNPFDWRHQFRKRKSSSPEVPALSDRGSPMPESKRVYRKASASPDGNTPRTIASSVGGASDTEFELEPEPEPEPEPAAQKSKHARDESYGGDSPDGLVIDFDEGQPPRGRQGALRGLFGDQHGQKPRSLTSVASSRSRSRQPISRRKMEEQEFDIEMDMDPSPPPEESDGGRSDLDVSDIEVGSPVHKQVERSSREQSQEAMEELLVEEEPEHIPEPEAEEVGEDEGGDDIDAAFDDFFGQMEEGNADDQGGIAVGGEDDESEVSEAD